MVAFHTFFKDNQYINMYRYIAIIPTDISIRQMTNQ